MRSRYVSQYAAESDYAGAAAPQPERMSLQASLRLCSDDYFGLLLLDGAKLNEWTARNIRPASEEASTNLPVSLPRCQAFLVAAH
jgi:hypothetical protein